MFVTNRLNYGFEKTARNQRLYVDVPTALLERVQGMPDIIRNLERLSSKDIHAIDIETESTKSRLYVNAKKIGKLTLENRSNNAAKEVVQIITALDRCKDDVEADEKMSVVMGWQLLPDRQRYGMWAKITWPEAEAREVAKLSTDSMRDTASYLMEEPKWLVDELVYADVSRAHGVTLETNPMGSCSIGTNGQDYDSTAPDFELHAHNIYNHSQQLICLVGVVALAKADSLLQQRS